MLGILTGEESKSYKRGTYEKSRLKTMGKYSLMKWFYNDQRIQFYMHDFMCIDTETIP